MYATPFGVGFHWCALDDLTTLARDPVYERFHGVARAVTNMYRAETARDVLATVRGWADSEEPQLRAHADRCLVSLALHTHLQDGLHLPLLGADEPRVDLTDVWRSALLRPWTAADAWYALEYWLHRADEQPALAGAVTRLLSRVITGRSLSQRFTFYTRQWRHRMPANRTLDRLGTLLFSAPGG